VIRFAVCPAPSEVVKHQQGAGAHPVKGERMYPITSRSGGSETFDGDSVLCHDWDVKHQLRL